MKPKFINQKIKNLHKNYLALKNKKDMSEFDQDRLQLISDELIKELINDSIKTTKVNLVQQELSMRGK